VTQIAPQFKLKDEGYFTEYNDERIFSN